MAQWPLRAGTRASTCRSTRCGGACCRGTRRPCTRPRLHGAPGEAGTRRRAPRSRCSTRRGGAGTSAGLGRPGDVCGRVCGSPRVSRGGTMGATTAGYRPLPAPRSFGPALLSGSVRRPKRNHRSSATLALTSGTPGGGKGKIPPRTGGRGRDWTAFRIRTPGRVESPTSA